MGNKTPSCLVLIILIFNSLVRVLEAVVSRAHQHYQTPSQPAGTQLSFLKELFPLLRPHSSFGHVLVGFHKPHAPRDPPRPPKGSRTLAAAKPPPSPLHLGHRAVWVPPSSRLLKSLSGLSNPLDPAVLLRHQGQDPAGFVLDLTSRAVFQHSR